MRPNAFSIFRYLFLVGLSALPSVASANGSCETIGAPVAAVGRTTNYAPSLGGINGRCGRSASGRDACKYRLEDYVNGRAEAVMAAVPQKGEIARLFGGMYRAPSIEKALGTSQCVRIIAGDRYGKGSNDKSKMDVCTRERRSREAIAVNGIQRNELIPMGRMAGIGSSRRVRRNAAAQSPVNALPAIFNLSNGIAY